MCARSLSVCLVTLALFVPAVVTAQGQSKPESLEDRVSYSLGLNMGRALAKDGIDVNTDYLVQGVLDGIKGGDLLLTDQEIQSAMQEMTAILQERRAAAGEAAKSEGTAFLAENAKRSEVTTTSSGLQYEVLQEGSGAKPKKSDTVTVHYRGTLLDGEVFDSSYERGQPATFGLDGVIAGWTEGLQLMPVGSKYKFFIPAELAYGERGTPGGPIPPNSTLVFEVELLKIGE